jgi:hypothetical protein
MKQLRSSRHIIKMWHRREKATIDHLVRAGGDAQNEAAANAHSAFTPSGLAVEAQIRKAWPQNQGGLPIF